MLLRREPGRAIAVPQPSHSWVSGQMAAVWGNERFERPKAFADWCLAAAIHDIGWAAWELAPARNPESGWPRTFPQVSPLIHVDLWREGVARARLFGRYPALLVSRHADTIYARRFDWTGVDRVTADAIRDFLDEQHALQDALAASLAADPVYGDAASPAAIDYARLALAALDELSLLVCWGVDRQTDLAEVPTAPGVTSPLSLQPTPEPGIVTVTPWPFAIDRVTVRFDGKALDSPFGSDEALRAGLDEAPPVAIVVTLEPTGRAGPFHRNGSRPANLRRPE